MKTLISIIVTTYNWPQALNLVLRALLQQSDQHFEVLIADDGSRSDTATIVQHYQAKNVLPIRHIWQEDQGFRAARVRNLAVLAAQGDYLIFIDGDCLPVPQFVARHRALARQGYFVSGQRILLQAAISAELQSKQRLPHEQPWWWLGRGYFQRQINRLLPLFYLPFLPRDYAGANYHGAKTCNFALWRQDFVRVNGFEEQFQGWGFEDSELVVRLFNAGLQRRSAKCAAPVWHLWHNEHDRSHAADNLARLQQRLQQHTMQAECGLAEHHGL